MNLLLQAIGLNFAAMSKAELFAELEKLTSEERQEVKLRLAELDDEEWVDSSLTPEQKELLASRFEDSKTGTIESVPWRVAEKSSYQKLGS